VLAAVTGPFTNSDTLAFDGSGIRRVTAPAPRTQRTGFVPSQHGFRFSNAWPRNVPHLTITVAGNTVGLFDAGMGLCGGMVYAALDYHATGARPAVDHAPQNGALFDYLCRRLTDSFGGAAGVARYLHLMHPSRPVQELTQTMVAQEWPAIQASLDAGQPVPLALVLVESADPFELGKNHQVLATGYDLDSRRLALHLYDPNHPGRDDLRLTLDIGTGSGPAGARLSVDNCAVRAFFRTGYQRMVPPAAGSIPADPLPPRRGLAAGGIGWVEANGHVGLIHLGVPDAGGQFNGTVYGNALRGRWVGDTLEFVREVGPGYDQVWSGRRRADGSVVGSFIERLNLLTQPGTYSWRAHSDLMLDGNGWPGLLTLENFFADGSFVGRAYGQPARGRWDAGTQQLSFTREIHAGYVQEWVGTRSHGLNFDGEFRERTQGQLQATRFRWLARMGAGGRDTVCLTNHLGRAVQVRAYGPGDRRRAVPAATLVLASGQRAEFTIPLGLPLALTHVALVFDTVGEMLAGYGDDIEISAGGRLTLV
jgi:hypothetical protein